MPGYILKENLVSKMELVASDKDVSLEKSYLKKQRKHNLILHDAFIKTIPTDIINEVIIMRELESTVIKFSE